MNKDKPRSSKCRHFCFPFDTHNYCPTCRESGKGDYPCVTFENPCEICTSFTEEQLLKISQRKRYIKKQKKATASSKDDELDLLGDDVDSFTGSQADLESAADNLFTSSPHPQPLPFSSLSLKTPAKTVPPTPGTALQQKIESNLEKSLGNTLNIHLQQQMGSFPASMSEAFQSLRDELTTKKQAEVDQTSASASKPGPSTSAVNLDLPPPRPRTTSHAEEMDVNYGPTLPPRLRSDLHNASVRILMHPRSLLRRSRIHLINTLTVGMRLNRGLPRINSMMNPMNLGFHLLNPIHMLIRVDIRSGPDTCHLPQRRISPLQPDTGLQSPLGLSLLGPSLTKINLNMIQTPLIIGK